MYKETSINIIYAADASVLQEERLFAAAYNLASDRRKQKTDRYCFLKDRCSSLGAELLLRKALGDLGVYEFSFSYGEAGKPYLAGQNGLYFNLSHSGNYILCAVSDHEIGCDIEIIRDTDLHIAKRFFHRNEYEIIASQTTDRAKSELFFRYWTLKESFLKATGLGMQLPLDQFEILLKDEISVIQNVDSRRYSFREYNNIDSCQCAVCTADAPFHADLTMINLEECL